MISVQVTPCHKIAGLLARETQAIELPDVTFTDRKSAGKALRAAGLLAAGQRIRELQVTDETIVVFPCNAPGMTSGIHSLIFSGIEPNGTYARYSTSAPTGCDQPGLGLPDRQTWFVAPCSRNRDSGPLGESNFAVSLALLGGLSSTCEVHRFGHWACGWFELILVHPIRVSELPSVDPSDYPVLSDDDLSEREHAAESADWDAFGSAEFLKALAREHDLSNSTVDWFDSSEVYELAYQRCEMLAEYTDEGTRFDTRCVRAVDRDSLAAYIRECRAERHSTQLRLSAIQAAGLSVVVMAS